MVPYFGEDFDRNYSNVVWRLFGDGSPHFLDPYGTTGPLSVVVGGLVQTLNHDPIPQSHGGSPQP